LEAGPRKGAGFFCGHFDRHAEDADFSADERGSEPKRCNQENEFGFVLFCLLVSSFHPVFPALFRAEIRVLRVPSCLDLRSF